MKLDKLIKEIRQVLMRMIDCDCNGKVLHAKMRELFMITFDTMIIDDGKDVMDIYRKAMNACSSPVDFLAGVYIAKTASALAIWAEEDDEHPTNCDCAACTVSRIKTRKN